MAPPTPFRLLAAGSLLAGLACVDLTSPRALVDCPSSTCQPNRRADGAARTVTGGDGGVREAPGSDASPAGGDTGRVRDAPGPDAPPTSQDVPEVNDGHTADLDPGDPDDDGGPQTIVMKGLGAACASASECGSGHCADGVCCDDPCEGGCRTCSQPGAVGACTAVMPGSLLGHWPLDEGGGTAVSDRSCYENGGALVGAGQIQSDAGRRGRALRLDGGGQWVEVPWSDSLEAMTQARRFSVTVWVNRASTQSGYALVVSRQFQAGTREHFAIGFRDGRPTFIARNYEGSNASCSTAGTAPLGRWLHLAGTWDGTTARLYVDGTPSCSFARGGSLMADRTPVLIGGNVNDSSGRPNNTFNGLIDEVGVYARALSATEVKALAGGEPLPRD